MTYLYALVLVINLNGNIQEHTVEVFETPQECKTMEQEYTKEQPKLVKSYCKIVL